MSCAARNPDSQMQQLLKFLSAFALLHSSFAMAIEEPAYDVLLETPAYEVRRYAAYLVAEVDLDGDFTDAGNAAFRILAGYIFGDNKPGEKMAMTAPVESTSGEKMKMTAPVTSSSQDDGTRTTFAFVMESKYTRDTLPEPVDSRIRIVERPARTLAVHRYSGRWTKARYDEHEAVLLEALQVDQIDAIGAPVFARYNAPFTPWFLRRNEIMVEISGQLPQLPDPTEP
jgi:hypothetical protein